MPRRDTALGSIPEDWDVYQVGDITLTAQYGLSIRGEASGRCPILRMNCQVDGEVSLHSLQYVDVDDRTLEAFALSRGDILFNRTNSYELVGRTAVFEHDVTAVCASYLVRLAVDRSRVDPRFLNFLINWDVAQAELKKLASRGVSQANISASKLKGFSVHLPKLPEQQAIVNVLQRVRGLIATERKLEEQSTSLKEATLNKLFTGGLRGEPQKETEIGAVPTSWEETTLGALCSDGDGTIQTGPFGSQLHAHEYEPEGVPVVNPTHLDGNRINHAQIPKVSSATAARLDRHKLETGDILFARRGEIGRHGLVGSAETGWLCGTGCFVVRARASCIHTAFLARFFSTEGVVSWLTANAGGTIMPNLNSVVLSRLPVAYPLVEEQQQIVRILDAIDRKIALHHEKRAVLELLFDSLLHELMTGKVRVSDLDLSVANIPTVLEAS